MQTQEKHIKACPQSLPSGAAETYGVILTLAAAHCGGGGLVLCIKRQLKEQNNPKQASTP